MSYTTQDQMAARFGEDELIALADRDRDGAADPDIVAQAIADASAEIDGYLGTRYRVPLAAPAPPMVASLCADIARYRLMDERPLEEAVKRYEAAVRFLRDVAAGRAALGIPQDQPAPLTPFRYAATRGERDRTFTRDTLEGY